MMVDLLQSLYEYIYAEYYHTCVPTAWTPRYDDEANWPTRSDNGLDKSARSERRANMTQLIAFSFRD